ncbi:NAD(P)H-dependent flavin oxidoreductase [Pseudoduganella sp. GCM10020061]|uniref:NAD(P)H-dependent flavin oxidoreductase n=1 Tax=Pseudoduganella sp. GCM10020061 TaxID=3317345 RepID=UPI003644B987
MSLQSLFRYPIIQAAMAGGSNTPQLVAAVSNAGGLGSFAGSLLSPSGIAAQVAEIRSLTDKPFLINLFVQPMPSPPGELIEAGKALLEPVRQRMGLDALPTPAKWCEDFAAQFELLFALRPAAASFTFDIISADDVQRLHLAGISVIGMSTTVEEALAWEKAGADAVIASGTEAGGHRGTFIGPQEEAVMTSAELWPAVIRAVGIPVIAAGGIMDGRDIRRALEMGAAAAQLGTAFLACDESGISAAYKGRLKLAEGQPTRLTRAISGRYARGIENEFMRLMAPVEKQVPPYPIQNALTTSIRAAAAAVNDTEMMSLWAGAGVSRTRAMPAARLMETLINEMRD